MKSLIIAVSGGSGSGKTTFSRLVRDTIHPRPKIISMDNYYKDLRHLPMLERAKTNFDDPASLDWELFLSQLEQLYSGQTIESPKYSFKTHTRMQTTRTIRPGILIVEGIFPFCDERCIPYFDMKIYIDTSEDVRLQRRITRDVRDRSRTIDSVITQWNAFVKPMHDRFIETTKNNADIFILNDDYAPCLDAIKGNVAEYLLYRKSLKKSSDFKKVYQ